MLEEIRDAIVMKLLRQLQAEVIKRFRVRDWAKRRDQRELIRVCQRQFRKYIALRDWGKNECLCQQTFVFNILKFRLVYHPAEDKTFDWIIQP